MKSLKCLIGKHRFIVMAVNVSLALTVPTLYCVRCGKITNGFRWKIKILRKRVMKLLKRFIIKLYWKYCYSEDEHNKKLVAFRFSGLKDKKAMELIVKFSEQMAVNELGKPSFPPTYIWKKGKGRVKGEDKEE